MLYNGYPIALRAWRVWRREGRLNIDFLDALAITASLLLGNPMAGAIIVWLIKLGDWIRDLTAAGQRKAMSELLEFQARTAWVIREGVVTSIPSTELVIGDEVVIYPGDMISVDGEIIDGHAMIDQKTITGEGLPVMRGVGEPVFAATVIRDGQLTVRAIRVGTATTAGQIANLVELAPIGDTRMQNHAEKLADRLVDADTGAGGWHRRGQRRLQPLPLAGDRRLRHRHPRRGADRRACFDDPCRARRHHHQERRPYGETLRGRHHHFRQDRYADARLAGSRRRHQL